MREFDSVQSYIDSFKPKTKAYLEQIREIIHELMPNTRELINYGVVAFTVVEGGKRDQQIMMAGYKQHVGFYPHPAVMEHFWDQLDGWKKGKGSVQFPLDKPLPASLIEDMIRYRLKMPDLQK